MMISIRKTFPLLLTIGTVLLNGCPQQATTDAEKETETKGTNEKVRKDHWLTQQVALEEKRKEGVNFYAFGSDESWTASIDADRSFQFGDGEDISLRTEGITTGVRPADLNAIVYRTSSGNESITLSAYPDSCKDASTGETFPYTVTGTHRTESGEVSTYAGCGLFLTDPALNDIYVLRSWSAYADLRQEFEKEAPRFELHFQNNTVHGFDGRCHFFGKFEPMGDRLYFYELDFLDDACKKDERSPFFDHLNIKEHIIRLENGQLKMVNGRDILTFTKVD